MRKWLWKFAAFLGDKRGSVEPLAALALIPVVTAAGGAIDYSRVNASRTALQGALDAAVLAGARDRSSAWDQRARNVFDGNIQSRSTQELQPSASFTRDNGGLYRGSATANIKTAFLGLIRIDSFDISAKATAIA